MTEWCEPARLVSADWEVGHPCWKLNRRRILSLRVSCPLMTRHRLAVLCGALVCPILYLVFVTHFWVNEPNLDDWNALWLVSQSMSGHLTFAMLWAQHNENRMLVPNLVFVAVGRASQGNEEVVMALSAALFIVTYFAFLGLCRSYLGFLSWRVTLVVGIVWFSIVDYGNALTAFQLAWYLVLACFVGMLCLLMGRSRYRVPAAIALAVLASFSSLQGLLLWPIGLLCLRWNKVRVAAVDRSGGRDDRYLLHRLQQ